MSYIDALEVTIQMTKTSSELPNLAGIKATAIKKALKLSVDAETLKGFGLTHYRVIKSGEKSDTISFADGQITGYPTLKVRVYSYPDMANVKGSIFHDDKAAFGSCFSYLIDFPSDEPCYFEDQNGLTDISRVTSEMKPSEWFEEKLMEKCIAL